MPLRDRPVLDAAELAAELLALVAPTDTVVEGLARAGGRRLAAEVVAIEDVPNVATSAMDGHAVRAADVRPFVVVPVHATRLAGADAEGEAVPAGAAVRIMTGAPVPAGLDTVVPLEEGREVDGGVLLPAPAGPGRHVRAVGEDVGAGTRLGVAGDRVGLGLRAVARATGVREVQVHAPPRVALLGTGDELVGPDAEHVPPGGVRNSNRGMLADLLTAAGADVTDLGHVADRPTALAAALAGAARTHDLVVTTGGVSVGDADHLPDVLAELGTSNSVHVRLRPGRPLAWAEVPRADGRRALVLALPGNPLAALATGVLFALPVVRRLAGVPVAEAGLLDVRLLAASVPPPEAHTVVRLARRVVDATGRPAVEVLAGRQRLGHLAAADAVVVLRPGAAGRAGDLVEVLVLP